jgi:class 3 adenylate cyclase/tetratricopeptide (TPR) repeat protein
MKKCPQCQIQNADNANFCNNCGTKLQPSNKSPKATSLRNIKSGRLAERRQLTILFCDLVGSTPLSEQLDPEEYSSVITGYHHVAEKVVQQFGGHIAQYLGDGLLVYFGYPEGLEDAPAAALRTGLGILKAVEQANERWEAEGGLPIKIRIGVHTGLVVVDDHLALGEAVNVAARLEGLAPHNGMVISPQTYKLAKAWFEVKSLGEHTLKGITQPMEVYQVLNETGVKTRLDASKTSGLSPLVGRQNDLQLLNERWQRAKKSNGNLVLINGEAGIGKSRLADTLRDQVLSDPTAHVMEAYGSAYHINSSFFPIIELLEKRLLLIEQDDSPQKKLIKLENFLLKLDLDFKENMPLLAEFLSIPSEQFPPPIISPFAKKQRLLESLIMFFLAQANEKPLFFLMEDMHWCDASTKEWMNLFLEQLPTHPIFILCTTRPGFRPDWIGRSEVTQITLQRLSEEDMAQISNHLTGGRALPEEILDQISDKTEGVPLFVEELTKMITESDILVEKEGHFEIAGSINSLTIPSSLQDSLLARIDRLGNVKDVVQVGAVLGRDFSFELLNALLPQKTDSLERSLYKLSDAEIFFKKGLGQRRTYQFKHALIRDAAYESLLKSRRQQLHHRVANVMEHQFQEIAQTQPEIVAYHYTEANQALKAIPKWLIAGQMASQKNATSEAIAHLQKGISLLHNIKDEGERNNIALDFYLTLGGTYVVSHGFPHEKVKETFDKARDIAQNTEVSPKLALVLMNLLSFYMNRQDLTSHSELTNYVKKLSDHPQHGYWFELAYLQLSAGPEGLKGNLEKAINAHERLMEIFNPSLPFPWELAPSGYIEIGSKAWAMLSYHISGQYGTAKMLFDNHLAFADHHSDSMTLYHIYSFRSLYNLEARDWKAAEETIDIYFPIVRAFGDPVFNLTAEVYHAIAKAYQGDQEAYQKAIHLIKVCWDIGFIAFANTMSAWIAELHLNFGEYETCKNWINKAFDYVNSTGAHMHTAELYRMQACNFQALGQTEALIEEHLQKAIQIAQKQKAKTFELRASSDLARLWHKQGKTKDAYELVKKVYDWFEEGIDNIDLNEVRDLLAELEREF